MKFKIEWHEPSAAHMLYIDAGHDPVDGAPLTMARRATPIEVHLWQVDQKEQLGAMLLGAGAPLATFYDPVGSSTITLRRESIWRRLWRWLVG